MDRKNSMGNQDALQVINPATGEKIDEHSVLNPGQVEDRIGAAHSAFFEWRRESFVSRGKVMLNAAENLIANKAEFARRITIEMGKPLSQSLAEIEKCAWVCRYYAEEGEDLLQDQTVATEDANVIIKCMPLGVIYAIMPWNFPFWQAFRAAVPALMAGNAMALKGAPNVPGCTSDITKIFAEAGTPSGLFCNLPIPISLSPAVIRNPQIRGITLTGSEAAGRSVAAEAGAQLKKCVLELGGSDPYIVLEDADLRLAADKCVTSRMLCAGQVCIAAKRIIVVDGIYDAFKRFLLEIIRPYSMSDPMQPDCKLGPLARKDLRNRVHTQVTDSIALGADLIMGGSIPERDGWWYPATVLENVHPGMPAFDDEIFGPVVTLIRADDFDHALSLAANTKYGLGGAIFSANRESALRRATEKMDVGVLAYNDFVRSDPRIPFGGTKASGYGRELGRAGIHEFVNLKSVVQPLSAARD